MTIEARLDRESPGEPAQAQAQAQAHAHDRDRDHARDRGDSTLATTAQACHPACIACRGRQAGGLGLRFMTTGEDSVRAEFLCDDRYQGYPDRLHGGVVAVLLDAAMTHCLFARGLSGVTARLDIRYREPVEFGVHGTVSARFLRGRGRVSLLTAEVEQHGVVCAEASGSFVIRN